MTLEDAIQTFRRLHWSAAEDWPMGVPPDLAEQSRTALDAIDTHLEHLPAGSRREAGRQIRQRIEAREHVATVAPRSRKQGQGAR